MQKIVWILQPVTSTDNAYTLLILTDKVYIIVCAGFTDRDKFISSSTLHNKKLNTNPL